MFFFFPLGTTRPHWRRPWATYGLIIINGLVMLYALRYPGAELPEFVPAYPDLLGLFGATFVHGSLGHLAGNMLFLWLFGTVAEDTFGAGLFLVLYFTGGFGAALLDWGMTATYVPEAMNLPRIGASGAIAGIMGLSAICFMRTQVRLAYAYGFLLYWRVGVREVHAPVFLAIWAGLQFVQGYVDTARSEASGGVAYWAHVGGFLVGALIAMALGLRKRVSREDLLDGHAKIEDTSGRFSHIGELQKVVAESPTDAAAWYALGQVQEAKGRTQPAAVAYRKALLIFLRQREVVHAAETYVALHRYQHPEVLPPVILFDLGCALEEAVRPEEAYDIFLLAAKTHPQTRIGETALIRAGEVARRFLQDPQKAGEAFWHLLTDYPVSDWRPRACEGLRALGLPEIPPWTYLADQAGEGSRMRRLE